MDEEMSRDSNVILFGEDVGIFGGCFGATPGLYDKYGPERVLDAPISEAVIAAAAFGASVYGKRVVAEIMFADFLTLCYDTMMNMAPQQRYLNAGTLTTPLVIRAPQGGGVNAAAHHSQDATSWLLNAPGITIVCPTTADELYGLLKASIRSDNFVLFLEHKKLYGTKCEVPEGEHVYELGKAKVVKEGKDVTIIANQFMRLQAEEACKTLEAEGISVELIDPLTIKPYDKETMVKSVNKTGRCLIVTESRQTGSYAAEFGFELNEACFKALKKPVRRLCTLDLPIPKGPGEAFILPTTEEIVAIAKELMA
jgi:pyruvate dehydrogenase E1 component beta subunit